MMSLVTQGADMQTPMPAKMSSQESPGKACDGGITKDAVAVAGSGTDPGPGPGPDAGQRNTVVATAIPDVMEQCSNSLSGSEAII